MTFICAMSLMGNQNIMDYPLSSFSFSFFLLLFCPFFWANTKMKNKADHTKKKKIGVKQIYIYIYFFFRCVASIFLILFFYWCWRCCCFCCFTPSTSTTTTTTVWMDGLSHWDIQGSFSVVLVHGLLNLLHLILNRLPLLLQALRVEANRDLP